MVIVTRNVNNIFNEAVNYMNATITEVMNQHNSFKEFKLTYNHINNTLSLYIDCYCNQFKITSWNQFNFEMFEELQRLATGSQQKLPFNFSTQ